MSNYIDFDSKKSLQKKSLGYSHHSAKCSLYTSFKFRVLCAAAAYWLQSPSATRFFFIFFFSHCFCTALFLLNHILFITINGVQHHVCQKKHAFATTSTQDDTFEVCYSRYQPIRSTFLRVTIYGNTNYTVYFRPVCYNILLFVFGLYLVCIFPFFGCDGLHSFNPFTTFFLVILCILL